MAMTFKDKILWLLRGGSASTGQTLVEYSLILAFIASMIFAIAYFVGGTGGLLDDIGVALQDALG